MYPEMNLHFMTVLDYICEPAAIAELCYGEIRTQQNYSYVKTTNKGKS